MFYWCIVQVIQIKLDCSEGSACASGSMFGGHYFWYFYSLIPTFLPLYTMRFVGRKGGNYQKMSYGYNFAYKLKWVGGDLRWLCRYVHQKSPLMVMVGQAKCCSCTDMGARTPISVCGIYIDVTAN